MGFLKIDGMASVPSAENNSSKDINHTEGNNFSLEDIIGKVSVYYPEEPDIVHVGPGLTIDENEYEVQIYNRIERSHFYYLKSDTRVEISPNKVCVYNKKFFCGLTKTFVEKYFICHVSPSMAISEYKIKLRPYDWCNSRENVPIIRTPGLHESYFVFNYVDACKQKMIALLAMLNKRRSLNQSTVQAEVIDTHILPLLGYVEVDGKKTQQFSPIGLEKEYTCEYKGNIPEYLSMAQLKKLYELGMVKMLFPSTMSVSKYVEYNILSDNAFDNSPDGALQKQFKTKLNMQGCIEKELKRLFNMQGIIERELKRLFL